MLKPLPVLSADGALDTRVTALEGNAAITDPTTATAVAAVQSDVDANQTASECCRRSSQWTT